MAIIPLPGEGFTLVCQRTAMIVEPGFLPGDAGFDGTDGAPFGAEESDAHDTTLIVFQALFRGAILGQVLDTPVALPVRATEFASSTDPATPIEPPEDIANLVPRESSLALTDAPLPGEWHNWGDGEHAPSGVAGFDGVTLKTDNATGTPAEAFSSPRHREILYQRFWADPIEAAYVALEQDAARGWLHTSAGTKIKTYHLQSVGNPYESGPILQAAFVSAVHEEVDQWRRIRCLSSQGGRLALLGQTGVSAYKLFLSADAGVSLWESLAMTNVASCLIDYIKSRNWLVVLYEDATTHQVYVRRSLDGGVSFESAVACQFLPLGGSSLEDMEGSLNDGVAMAQAGGALAVALIPPTSSTARILVSHDGGFEWRQVL